MDLGWDRKFRQWPLKVLTIGCAATDFPLLRSSKLAREPVVMRPFVTGALASKRAGGKRH